MFGQFGLFGNKGKYSFYVFLSKKKLLYRPEAKLISNCSTNQAKYLDKVLFGLKLLCITRIKILEVAERLQDVGCQAISIHGRTRAQMYKGEADWKPIAQVKDNPHQKP